MLEQVYDPFEEEINEEPIKERSDRYTKCGKKFKKYGVKTGKLVYFTYICGDFRQCPHCLKEKAVQEKLIVNEGLIHHMTNLVEDHCSGDEAQSLKRRLRDKGISYRCYNDIILHCDEGEMGRESFQGRLINNENDFHELPFGEWLRKIPDGKRVSGSGQMKATRLKEKDEKEYIEFWTFAVNTNAPKDVEDKVSKQVEALTSKPLTAEEVPDCIIARNRMFKHLLEEMGYVIYCVPVREKISKDFIPDW